MDPKYPHASSLDFWGFMRSIRGLVIPQILQIGTECKFYQNALNNFLFDILKVHFGFKWSL